MSNKSAVITGRTPTRAATPPRDVRAFWRVLLAVIAPLGPLCMGVTIYLASVAPQASQLTNPFIAYLMLPGVLSLAWVTRRRTPVLAGVGGTLALVGYTVLVQAPNLTAVDVAVDAAGLPREAFFAVAGAVSAWAPFAAAIIAFLVLHIAGLVLLGVAVLRSRVAPRWMGVALIVAAPLDTVLGMLGRPDLMAASFAVLAVGFASASVALLRTPDGEFDLPPGDEPAEPASPDSPRDLRRTWRLVFGILAPIAPLGVAVLRSAMPYDTVDSPATIAEKTLANPGFSEIAAWGGLALAVALVPGIIAVAWVCRRRAPVITTVAAIVAFIGLVPLIGSGGFPSDALAAVAAQTGLTDAQLAELMIAGGDDPSAMITGLTFVIGHIVGCILLGVAMLRSRAVPRWVGWALIVSQPLHFVAAVILANRPLDFVAWGLTAVAFAFAGLRLIRTPDEQFDLAPIPVAQRPRVAG